MSDQKKVLLAFSGGLDTTYCSLYLKELGYQVYTVTVNTGGFTKEELDKLEERSRSWGSESHSNVDVTEEFYQKAIKYLIAGNVLKNNIKIRD